MAVSDLTDVDSGNLVPQDHGVPTEALATAREATFQVTGLGCTKTQFGTAFVVAEQTMVTNAHVVAGIQAPRITIRGREVISRVVAFDPATDLAVLVERAGVGAPSGDGDDLGRIFHLDGLV